MLEAKAFLIQTSHSFDIYSNSAKIVLQLRKEVPTEVDFSAASFKVAVALTPAEALLVAGELLTVAALQVKAKA